MPNLIAQAPDIETHDLKILHGLAHGQAIEKIDGAFSHQAFRITKADETTKAAVAAHCSKAKLDFAFVDAAQALRDIKLIATDMDSTLITIECIDEIADYAGKKPQVAAVTESAMRGEIDWPTSLRQRVAALSGLPEETLARVYEERLKLSPGAETLVRVAKKHGIKLLLVSGGFTFFTEQLKARLGFDFAYSNTLEVADGRLTGRLLGPLCDADAKAQHLRDATRALGLAPAQVIAMGDGANDLKMMAAAGTSVAYRAKPVVREQATISLNHVGLDGVLALFPAD
jgi:phosphoserine phosphatase